ncbi:Secretion protein HlyD [Thiobacillus denitrificans ATCC 25259]|uniref:Secretion protein HlyD n=1 Tax=Thiobacillus denitrificans (strain ATCC 25259 / T1) TaxID=292415 RepID=Q3SMF0_THIDA|nr:efflux RND transporter periplasmic adaptor subunit [Thiobacillus denitrificans]AAZ96095.1 Secretion protein HlyD [Thiobacillus denitrificans ATCC 25259]
MIADFVLTRASALRTGLILALAGPLTAVAADVLALTPAQKKNLGVEIAPLSAAAASPALTYPARVTLPPASLRVVAAAGDALVTRLHVQPGDTVRRGAPLVTVAMPALAEAQNQLTQAQLRARLAAETEARDQKLFAEGLIAESRLRATQSAAASARADLAAARAARALLGAGNAAGSALTLVAPIAGVITESAAEPGQRVDAGTVLFKVADLSKLALEIPLSTTQSRQVAAGQRVSVVDSAATGRITALLPQLTAAQSVVARASLADPQNLLRPGQSVQVAIAGTHAAESLTVPAGALVWKGEASYVFVDTAKGLVPTAVRVLRRNATAAEVSGLAPGSRVAVRGVAALKAQWAGE